MSTLGWIRTSVAWLTGRRTRGLAELLRTRRLHLVREVGRQGDMRWNERHLEVNELLPSVRERALIVISLHERLDNGFTMQHEGAGMGLGRREAVRVARRLIWLAIKPRQRPHGLKTPPTVLGSVAATEGSDET